jgi:lysophospholipase L1-like esterase
MSLAAKFALMPLLVAQALLTRSRMPRLAEAAGAREGQSGPAPAFRLLVAGDSSAAGVGVAMQDDALAGQIVAALARQRLAVRWRLVAQSGLTSAGALALLQQAHVRAPVSADIAVLALGVNDVVDQVPSHRAMRDREAIVNWLRNACGVRHVVFAGLPPVHQFPGLPQPLRWISGADARRHDDALARWAATRGDVSHVRMAIELNPGVMADDGFHPGAPVYRQCGVSIGQHIADQLGEQFRRPDNPKETP